VNRFAILTVIFLLGSTGFCQTADTSGRTLSSPARDLSQYRFEEVIFKGGRSISAKQLYDTFNVRIGEKFNQAAIVQGLERLRQLYGDFGYINFTAVPTLQLVKDRRTVVVAIDIDEGQQFTFGKLLLF
jgi:outer membrane protein assembly factor BamA